MSIMKERKMLEKKYTNLALYHKQSLPKKGDRIMSVSPTAFYHQYGINCQKGDEKVYSDLNKRSHYGIRKKIEEEVRDIIKESFKGYFFKVKNEILSLSYEELNIRFQKYKVKRIKKDKYNRLIKLLRRWGEESKTCHYKLNSAQKRLSKKYN